MGNYADQADVQKELDALEAQLDESVPPAASLVTDTYIVDAEAIIDGVLAQIGYSSLPLTLAADVARLKTITIDFVMAAIGRNLLGEGSDPDTNQMILNRQEFADQRLDAIQENKRPLTTVPDVLVGLGAHSTFDQTDETTHSAKITHDQKF